MRKLLSLLVVGLLLCSNLSCSSRITNVMKSWEGKHKSQLIRSWGLPTEVGSDGLDGEVYVYRRSSKYTTEGTSKTTIKTNPYTGRATGETTYTPGQTFTFKKYRAFWINADGYIYSWKWKGW